MKIQVSTDNNIGGGEEFAGRVEADLAAALTRFSGELTRVQVHLGDESAGRSSGDDKRCMLEARPAGRAPITVTHHADTIEGACRGATDKLVRMLSSEVGRLDERKGGESIRHQPE